MFEDLKSFDYVVDENDWIYLVKGYILNRSIIIGTPIYSPGSERIKCKAGVPSYLSLSAPRTNLAVGVEREIGVHSIREHYERSSCLTGNESFLEEIPILQDIVKIARSQKASAHLFGSRRLGISNSYSDWDFLITSSESPKHLVNELVCVTEGKFRKFNSSELNERVNRYVLTEPWASTAILTRLFNNTTTYLKSDIGELGLFFSESTPLRLPEKLNDSMVGNITGRIMPNLGRSYSMPREILLRSSDKTHIIRTLSWSLSGLEALSSNLVRFSGLKEIALGEWWFGCAGSSFEIL